MRVVVIVVPGDLAASIQTSVHIQCGLIQNGFLVKNLRYVIAENIHTLYYPQHQLTTFATINKQQQHHLFHDKRYIYPHACPLILLSV